MEILEMLHKEYKSMNTSVSFEEWIHSLKSFKTDLLEYNLSDETSFITLRKIIRLKDNYIQFELTENATHNGVDYIKLNHTSFEIVKRPLSIYDLENQIKYLEEKISVKESIIDDLKSEVDGVYSYLAGDDY